MARRRGVPAVRLLTAAVIPFFLGGASGAGLDLVYADPNLFVLGFLLVGCLLYASILVLDAVAEYRDGTGEDASDAPSGR